MEKIYKAYVTYLVLTKGFNIMVYENVSAYFTVQHLIGMKRQNFSRKFYYEELSFSVFNPLTPGVH